MDEARVQFVKELIAAGFTVALVLVMRLIQSEEARIEARARWASFREAMLGGGAPPEPYISHEDVTALHAEAERVLETGWRDAE